MRKENRILNKNIKKYDYIAIFGHTHSDLDSLGSCFGLKEWIKANFKNKIVEVIGKDNHKYQPSFFPKSKEIIRAKKYLAICLDVNDIKRVEKNELFKKSSFKVCLDHHYFNDLDNFDLVYIDTNKMSCAEVILDFLSKNKKRKITPLMAKYLYTGIIGDSNMFYFDKVDYTTFKKASLLVKKGNFNPFSDVHMKVIKTSYNEFKKNNLITQKINYEQGFAYYYISKKEQKEYNLDSSDVTNKINAYYKVEDFKILLAIAEEKDNSLNCSLRSKEKSVLKIAQKYGGGGHEKAAGIKGLNSNKKDSLIKDLKTLL